MGICESGFLMDGTLDPKGDACKAMSASAPRAPPLGSPIDRIRTRSGRDVSSRITGERRPQLSAKHLVDPHLPRHGDLHFGRGGQLARGGWSLGQLKSAVIQSDKP